MQNFEAIYGECLSLILRDILLCMQHQNQTEITAKTITIRVIQKQNLNLGDYETKNLQKRIKNKLKRLAKGGLVIVSHKITPRKTIENTYTPNF